VSFSIYLAGIERGGSRRRRKRALLSASGHPWQREPTAGLPRLFRPDERAKASVGCLRLSSSRMTNTAPLACARVSALAKDSSLPDRSLFASADVRRCGKVPFARGRRRRRRERWLAGSLARVVGRGERFPSESPERNHCRKEPPRPATAASCRRSSPSSAIDGRNKSFPLASPALPLAR